MGYELNGEAVHGPVCRPEAHDAAEKLKKLAADGFVHPRSKDKPTTHEEIGYNLDD